MFRGYSGRSSGRSGTSVIVTNLQWKTSWKELKDLFKSCGLVLRYFTLLSSY